MEELFSRNNLFEEELIINNNLTANNFVIDTKGKCIFFVYFSYDDANNTIIDILNRVNLYISDFWAQLFEWHTTKILSFIGIILSMIGFIPLMLNMIEYNQNQHIR